MYSSASYGMSGSYSTVAIRQPVQSANQYNLHVLGALGMPGGMQEQSIFRESKRNRRGNIVFQQVQNFATEHNFQGTISKSRRGFPAITSQSGATRLDSYGAVLYKNHYVIDTYKPGHRTIPRFVCGFCEVICSEQFCRRCTNSANIVISHHESSFVSRKMLTDSMTYSICAECRTCKIENTELCQTCNSDKINWIEWLVQQNSHAFDMVQYDHYSASDYLKSLFTFTYPDAIFYKSCSVKSFMLFT